MGKRITIIQGHPDPDRQHLGYALAESYADGARTAGHEVRLIEVARLDFPWLHTKIDFEEHRPPEAIAEAQEAIRWANHLVIFYPLWLGTMPAVLKAFLEQTLRPDFAFTYDDNGNVEKQLSGRSARVVVTMGMPAFVYRWYFGAHGLKNLRRNILGFCGIHPVNSTLLGRVESADETRRQGWLLELYRLGAEAL
ncbi:dehydrogenase [Marinobacterium nitratireducens]|uniref:Dehydrogenase n=1 Tax=Marinobacterium nitratireducens TaxID=518897 RepID=A0A917ZLR1_9GAMM|nr:NAD(P)H-dependent oxidoreductase [Marinobacterium nitratireducens]GGO86481.1 dehydrogenase [Marinobacterium nitratireducens]